MKDKSMKHKFIKISLIVISIFMIIIIFILFLYNPPCKVWDLGNGYYIDYDPNSDLALFASPSKPCEAIQGPIIILGPIIKYKFNSRFIAVKEKPREKIYQINKLDSIYNQEVKRRSIFDTIQYYDYWIIDKRVDSVYGPYQKKDFQLKFQELNLPDSLKIN